MSRALLLALPMLLLFTSQCGSRQDTTPYLPSADAGTDTGDDILDAGNDVLDAGGDTVDPPGLCSEPPLHMAFALETDGAAVVNELGGLDYTLVGTCTYHGPPQATITGDPLLTREVVLLHEDGTSSVFQYGLPHGREIPFAQGGSYTIKYHLRYIFEGTATGVRVERNTSGLVPLLFIGDDGEYGRALTEEDPFMAPLTVALVDDDTCPATEDPACGGEVRIGALHFDASGGLPYPSSVSVRQTISDVLPILGDEFLVTNLSSHVVSPTCPDLPGTHISYMALRPPEGEIPCDPDAIHVVTGDPFEVGTMCDDISFCIPAALAAEFDDAAPTTRCEKDDSVCGGDHLCTWYVPTNLVGAETYYEVCQASLLVPAGTTISCHIYL